MSKIKPEFLSELSHNLSESPQFIQVVLGPRQVGKTTGVLQLLESKIQSSEYFSADDRLAPTSLWIEEKWQAAKIKNPSCTLVLDEIQKVPQWSSVIKKLWDLQKKDQKSRMKLILLGSSSLQIQTGLTESLSGRFQLIRATHWGFEKSRQLANLDIDHFVIYGGYPGSYALLKNKKTWQKYIQDSIIETVIGKDILNLARVNKPALFRQVFNILMAYPAQDMSYTKLLGQLQDAGNTDLVKSYIELYEGAFLVKSLQKYSNKSVIKRSSSPKLIPLCGALIDRDVLRTKDGYGRAFEAAVGACLLNHGYEVFYWREGNDEVDYVIVDQGQVYAIEVKSGRKKSSRGLEAFIKKHPQARPLFITRENIEILFKSPRKFLSI